MAFAHSWTPIGSYSSTRTYVSFIHHSSIRHSVCHQVKENKAHTHPDSRRKPRDMQQGGQIRKVMAGIRRIILYHIISCHTRAPQAGRQHTRHTNRCRRCSMRVWVCGVRTVEREESPRCAPSSIHICVNISQSVSQSINTCPS